MTQDHFDTSEIDSWIESNFTQSKRGVDETAVEQFSCRKKLLIANYRHKCYNEHSHMVSYGTEELGE